MSLTFRKEYLKLHNIEQLPPLEVSDAESSTTDEDMDMPLSGYPMKTTPVPGKKCPECAGQGRIVWVIPGKRCPECGTAVN
ncbi:hypothetical protein BDV97DRAFT_400787 [Delphinella strobiligena]|nr:hypothetical protein BDV97DRAFT_400787 [Delphinella strobiligena]